MKKLIVTALFALALAAPAAAQTPVTQGNGSTRVIPWSVALKTAAGTATSAATPLALTTGAPLARVSISGVSADSGAVLVAGNVYRIACTTDCFFRWGAGAQTALTTDTVFFGPGVEYLTAPAGVTNVAFITTSAPGFCTITTLSVP